MIPINQLQLKLSLVVPIALISDNTFVRDCSVCVCLSASVIECACCYLCLRFRGSLVDWFPCGSWKSSLNTGWNLRKMTVETSKLRSSRSVRSRKSCERPAISAHFLILEKNWMRLVVVVVRAKGGVVSMMSRTGQHVLSLLFQTWVWLCEGSWSGKHSCPPSGPSPL